MKYLIIILLLVCSTSIQAKVSFSFDNVDVQMVLKSLAKTRHLNLICSDKVVGTISIEFDQVEWQKALSLIMQLKGLEYEIHDNILVVAPSGELSEHRIRQLELEQKVNQALPLVTKLFAIRFAKANDLLQTLTSSKEAILSSRAQVSADERTNTLIVRDTEYAIEQLTPVIAKLDVKAKQVVIEARIVTVRDNLDQLLGVQWGTRHSTNSNIASSGSFSGIEQLASATSGPVNYLERLNVNLPVPNPAGLVAVQVAKLANGNLLDLELSALERESKGEIIASPRILATNQHTSRIEQGTEIPYLQAAAHGATSVAFKKAVLSLEVTPQITPEQNIILDLVITQDARGDTVVTSTGPAVAIDTQQIVTRVTAKSGETIVLGGIYQEQVVNAFNKVPVLSDIPYLGRLFKSDTSYNEKRQLLVFVTPKLH